MSSDEQEYEELTDRIRIKKLDQAGSETVSDEGDLLQRMEALEEAARKGPFGGESVQLSPNQREILADILDELRRVRRLLERNAEEE